MALLYSLADLKAMMEVVNNEFQAWSLALNFEEAKVIQVGLSPRVSNDFLCQERG